MPYISSGNATPLGDFTRDLLGERALTVNALKVQVGSYSGKIVDSNFSNLNGLPL